MIDKDIDVTDKIRIGGIDGDCIPIQNCICGKQFESWDFILHEDEDDPRFCECVRGYYAKVQIKIYQTSKQEES